LGAIGLELCIEYLTQNSRQGEDGWGLLDNPAIYISRQLTHSGWAVDKVKILGSCDHVVLLFCAA
jgi:hypothetical protein